MDSDEKFAIAGLTIVCAVIVAITYLCVTHPVNATTTTEDVALVSPDVSPAIEHANESPLDAVVYDAPPVFASYGSSNAYKITDRFSKSEWWLVEIGAEWVVLPITNTEVTNVG